MKLREIPITASQGIAYKNNYYIYCSILYNCITNYFYTFDENKPNYYADLTLTKDRLLNTTNAVKMSIKTVKETWDEVPTTLWLHEEFICLMPTEVFEAWSMWVNKFSPKSRNSWTKLYFYLYFKIHNTRNGLYQHSRELIAAELGMSVKDISARIKRLVQDGWLIDSRYIPHIEAKYYTLPENLFSKTFKKPLT